MTHLRPCTTVQLTVLQLSKSVNLVITLELGCSSTSLTLPAAGGSALFDWLGLLSV